MKSKKSARYFKGLIGEYIALFWYLFRFYWPLERRYKNYCGEIDLILMKFNTIIFAEVKFHKAGLHENIISQEQKARIRAAAELYLARNIQYKEMNVRFDLVVIKSYSSIPQIVENNW